ncbi:hypothetical protein GDO81_011471 [Engystomops pustulosus]|uniref:Uncharacterized protein n=1 Tax=Engystomops pustulosus TaxID=76066 RepID=A0AAV7BEA3_ENGPU|nr:hypothetical protein GDO81_011471 [Engystomops pustulosus]
MTMVRCRCIDKFAAITSNKSHPLYHLIANQLRTFSERYCQISCCTKRFRNSFIPMSIELYNKTIGTCRYRITTDNPPGLTDPNLLSTQCF